MPRPPRLKAGHACWVWSLALILLLAFAPSLPAATVITGDVTPALPWTGSETALIGFTEEGTLTVDGASQLTSGVSYLGFNSGSMGTATIAGAGSKWTNNLEFYVGRSGSGSLRVEDGGEVSSRDVYLGQIPDGEGIVTITGVGSKWTSNALYVGLFGSGKLHVEAGGQVTSNFSYFGAASSNATGEVTITGDGTTLTSTSLTLGQFGSGALRVEAGGHVDSGSSYLGLHPSSIGTATITGPGSRWANSGSLYVGRGGSGSLTVEDGGVVSPGVLYASLGDLHGDGTITAAMGAVLDADMQFNAAQSAQAIFGFGEGGTLTVAATGGILGAGYKGLGSLTIAEGVAVSSSAGYLGHNLGSAGAATITGVGSSWSCTGVLSVGLSGSGALNIANGGQVSSGSGRLGQNPGSTGAATVTGAGSKWTNTTLYVGGSSISVGAGALRVEASGQVSSASSYLGDRFGSTGMAIITGVGSNWTNSAALYVGRIGRGSLSITAGALVCVGGVLTIDANGGSDSFVNMTTGGMLALWGNADDSLAQFLGLVAGSDAIRYWNTSIANWAPLTAATLGVDYTLQYQSAGDLTGYTLLTVLAPGPPGDFDFDGRVDGADFLAWQRGASPTPGSSADLATWRANFGLGAATPAAAAIPEPRTIALLGLALASLSLACPRAR